MLCGLRRWGVTATSSAMEAGFDPAWIFDREPAQVYKHDARSRVWRIDAADGRSFVVKRFEYSPIRQLLGFVLGLHPGQRERRRARHLKAAGLTVAPIIASGVQRRGVGVCYWLVTPYLGTSLYHLFYQGELTDADRRERVLQAVGRLTGELIRLGIFNRDHKASNIVVDGEDRPWLIDVGAVRRFRGVAGAVRMLANLCQTLAEAGATQADLALVRRASGADSQADPNG